MPRASIRLGALGTAVDKQARRIDHNDKDLECDQAAIKPEAFVPCLAAHDDCRRGDTRNRQFRARPINQCRQSVHVTTGQRMQSNLFGRSGWGIGEGLWNGSRRLPVSDARSPTTRRSGFKCAAKEGSVGA